MRMKEMANYIENPKMKGSGILACIPQREICPMNCEDCFFQSGRSYLEPLEENLPNIPPPDLAQGRLVRINDGNDSNHLRPSVTQVAAQFPMRFYNTSIPKDLEGFDAPVVLTVNPAQRTDGTPVLLREIPRNLMFVRVRTNTWNLDGTVEPAVRHYTEREVPIILTFMAYYTGQIPDSHEADYIFRKRTLNDYWAITTAAWERVMSRYRYNRWVYSCGKIEGEKGVTSCRHCGNCLREYFATMERMHAPQKCLIP